jgi:hemerythrin-like domain-containing protein
MLFSKEERVDVLSIIKAEHKEVGALIEEANKCEAGDARLRQLAEEIATKLAAHLAIEERLFYAKLKSRVDEEEEKVDVFEAYTEHTAAKSLMQLLKTHRRPNELFKAEVQVLGENVKHHVEEEESKVFDIARELLKKDELDKIGEAWEKSKKRTTRPSPRRASRR